MLVLMFAAVQALAGLPVTAAYLDVEVVGQWAQLTRTEVFEVAGQDVEDAQFAVPKPPGSTITGVRIDLGDDVVTSKVVTPREAQDTYKAGLQAGRVAGITVRDEPDHFFVALEELPDGPVRLSVSWTDEARRDHGGLHLDLPIEGEVDPVLSVHLVGPVAIDHVELDATLSPMRGAPGEVFLRGPVDRNHPLTLRWTSSPNEVTGSQSHQAKG